MDRVVNLCQAARLRVPVGRDLRRLPLHLRLRPARRAAQAQREGRLVALDGAAARRRRRPRRRDPHGRRRSGRRAATSRPSPTRSSTAATARSASAPTSSTIRARARTAAPRTRFTEARQFNLMFKTHVGPVEDDAAVAYLRPETAQGIFVNFANVQTTTRKKPPFGIAQIGKSFRNEITPGNFIFRTREFEQMEMEFFVPPDEGAEVVRVLVPGALPAGTSTSASPRTMLRLRPHDADELSHYSAGTSDVEFLLPVGLGRARGHRQPHRLRPHAARRSSRARTSTTSTRRPTSATCRT